jgi:hypothetical protein
MSTPLNPATLYGHARITRTRRWPRYAAHGVTCAGPGCSFHRSRRVAGSPLRRSSGVRGGRSRSPLAAPVTRLPPCRGCRRGAGRHHSASVGPFNVSAGHATPIADVVDHWRCGCMQMPARCGASMPRGPVTRCALWRQHAPEALGWRPSLTCPRRWTASDMTSVPPSASACRSTMPSAICAGASARSSRRRSPTSS